MALAAVTALLTATARSAGDGPPRSETVEDVLGAFGVDVSSTPRVDADGEPLPESFTPLGGRRTIGRFDELVLFGIRLDDPALSSIGRMPAIDLVPGADNRFTATLLSDPDLAATPWLTSATAPRAAARADFDRDGVDELAVVYQEPGGPLELRTIQDGADGSAVGAPSVIGLEPVRELFVTSGDLDGDLADDLVVAMVTATEIRLRPVHNLGDRWTAGEADVTIPVVGAQTADVHVVLAAGNLDHDAPIELAVVVNEADALRGSAVGSARHAVYDDATTGFAVLRSGPVTVALPAESVTARTAGVAIGDVDADGVGEVVLGGLTAIGNTCNQANAHVMMVLDDARHQLAPMATRKATWFDTREPCSSGAQHYMNAFHVQTADLDGDGAAEIQGNEYIYDDLRAAGPALVELHVIPQTELLTESSSGSDYDFSWRTTAFATADVTSDRRDDLVFYTQRDGVQVVQVWGVDPIDGWKQIHELRAAFVGQTPARPQILTADLDLDTGSMALEYSTGSHRLVFTEPVLIAALAAAPCSTTLGQDVDGSCRTAFGKAVGETSTRTDGWSFVAGVSVGYEAEFSVLGVKTGGFEAIVNTRNTVRGYTTKAYTLTTQVLRETGPIEDAVIFTTVPLDIYTYVILSHPNPELVGGEIQIRMPRQPITIMAERAFYNASILPGALAIDEAVFQHVAGDPGSYRDAASKDALLRRFTGLQSDQVDVGQGSGQTVVSIAALEETSTGTSFDFEATLDLQTTGAGVVGGFSVGGGAWNDLAITHGVETIYQGSVGNLDAAHYPDGAYRFGLFTYLHDAPGSAQTFEVLDYWVEGR